MSNQFPGRLAQGAVDLGAMAAARQAQAKADSLKGSAPEGVIVDVTTASFELMVEKSMTVPIILDLWATWCQPCKMLSPILEGLAAAYGGRFILAKVDVDANQEIAAAFQVQSIPAVFAVIGGRPIPLFQEALPEAQVRAYIDEVLKLAAQAGVTGTVDGSDVSTEAPAEPAVDPRFAAADEAIDNGDWAAAAAACQALLDANPGDHEARLKLLAIRFYERALGLDPTVVASADADPASVDLALKAADVEVLDGDWSAAFARLVNAVRSTSGDERGKVRTRLIELFDMAGDDPAVGPARIALSNALF